MLRKVKKMKKNTRQKKDSRFNKEINSKKLHFLQVISLAFV